jgi:hypothetical protein
MRRSCRIRASAHVRFSAFKPSFVRHAPYRFSAKPFPIANDPRIRRSIVSIPRNVERPGPNTLDSRAEMTDTK